jgi:L-ribulose-5-phosphate 4-epimerase
MVEDVARTVHLAREAGPLVAIPQDAIDRLYDRYQNVYGQANDARRTTTDGHAIDARRTEPAEA